MKNKWLSVAIDEIWRIIEEADYMRNCYFWQSGCNANAREWYDKQHSHDWIEWEEGGHEYSACFEVSSHYSYIEAHGYYYKDEKRTNLTAIKSSYNRLVAKQKWLKSIGIADVIVVHAEVKDAV